MLWDLVRIFSEPAVGVSDFIIFMARNASLLCVLSIK